MRLIGRGCKRSDALSRPILIGRGLDLLKKRRERIENMLDRYSLVSALCSCQSAVKAERKKRYIRAKNPNIYHCGDNGGEVPPVPIPNTEVKLVRAEDTLPDTARENRSSLHPKPGYRTLCGIRIAP